MQHPRKQARTHTLSSCSDSLLTHTHSVTRTPTQFTASLGAIIFHGLCHCRACSRARGTSPVHLIGVPASAFAIAKGEELLKTAVRGKMTHTFCSSCGGPVYQCPAGAPFRAIFPASFEIEAPDASPCGVSCRLPETLHPKGHFNYENRLLDSSDALPKFTCFPGSPQLKNDGSLL